MTEGNVEREIEEVRGGAQNEAKYGDAYLQ